MLDETIRQAFERAKRRDKVASVFIVVGGIAIIVAVVAMLLLILSVAVPLFGTPSTHIADTLEATVNPGTRPVVAGMDDYFTVSFVVDSGGAVRYFDIAQKALREEVRLRDGDDRATIRASENWGDGSFSFLWSDDRTTDATIRIRMQFDEAGTRSVVPFLTRKNAFDRIGAESPVATAIRSNDDGVVTYAEQTPAGELHIVQRSESEDFLGNVTRDEQASLISPPSNAGHLAVFRLSESGEFLYLGTDTGHLIHYSLKRLGEPELISNDVVGRSPITSLGLVFGDITVAVGTEDGALTGWFPALGEGESRKTLKPIHTLASMPSAIAEIQGTRRNKVVMSRDAAGRIALNHMTSERNLLNLASEGGVSVMGLSAKSDGLVTLNEAGTMAIWKIEMPHPEISWDVLFGKIWYENYNEPEFVWQSSSPSDDYEPKFSMVPLILGTFKGAAYALFFAVPISLLGAIYTSQFAEPRFRSMIKPAVEIMASIPSVVVGFLIALWLAPIVDDFLVAFFLVLFMMPMTFIIFIVLYSLLDGSFVARYIARGYEFIVVAPVMIIACVLSWLIAIPVESMFFDGNMQMWLYENMGERYDQRNAIIISIGLGFAAIPIIFTMSEDALSGLPPNLRAASLALGASRWQTVWRVVFPSASPGIFAALIIGFGRVIGETMIVLMATGNTPILDWSPFNGMRTLSANIAVEIPEAPVDGTLYRILFLSAVILFLITFVLNTVAELIRQRLRDRYGQFQ